MRKMKNEYTPDLLCQSDETIRLKPFVQDIFQLGYEDTPNYEKLRFYLLKILLEQNISPNNQYDWNEKFVKMTQPMQQEVR